MEWHDQTPARAAQLDPLFAAPAELLTTNEPFFGEFTFDGSIKLKDMEAFYGLAVRDHDPNLTVDGLFAAKFEGKPEVGDHLPLGGAVLVVREVEDDRVVRAGLQLDAHGEVLPAAGRLAKVRSLLKDRLRRN